MKALRDVQDPEAKAAYRLFLWLLGSGIKTSYADLQAIRGELAMFQSNPSENWKVRLIPLSLSSAPY